MKWKFLLAIMLALVIVQGASALTMSCPTGYSEIHNCDFSSTDDANDCGIGGGTLNTGSAQYEDDTNWAFWTSGNLSLSDYSSIVALYNMTHPSDHTTYKFYGYETTGSTSNHHLLCEDGGTTQVCKPEPTYFPSCTGITYAQPNLYQTEWNDTGNTYETIVDDGSECSLDVGSATVDGSAGNDYLRWSIGNLNGGTVEMHQLIVCAPNGEVTPADSCTYPGSGDWEIQLSDNCVISDTQDAGSNAIKVVGDAGSLTVASGGELICKEKHIIPDDFDGDVTIAIESGGKWTVSP